MTTPRPRIAVVTHFYPSDAEPQRGLAVYHHVLALAEWADIEVCCLQPEYPKGRFLQPRTYPYKKSNASSSRAADLPVRTVSYPVFPLLSRPFNASICSARLTPQIQQIQPDLILGCFAYPDGRAAVLTGKKLDIPVIVEALGSDLRRVRSLWMRRLVRDTVQQAAFVVTVSDELRTRALQLGASPDRVRTIRRGCDADIFHLAYRDEARLELGISEDVELIVFVGRFVELKGLYELFTVLPSLAARRPRVRLACIGEGPLESELRRIAKNCDMTHHVIFPGSVEPHEVAQWLSASNLLCLPSHSEGLPNVVVEALSCGRPVVATEVGGLPEIVDPRCGILTPPRDPQRLLDALGACLSRAWDEQLIAGIFRRSWKDAAWETYQTCIKVLSSTRRFAPQQIAC
jgi:teichuronic acid biosynthesis glycosyltransferase TuaC